MLALSLLDASATPLKGPTTLPMTSSGPKKQRKKIQRRNNNSPDYVREKMSSPEMTAKRMEGLRKWRAANPDKVGRRQGQQDGVRLKDYLKRLEKAQATAEKAIKIMEEKKIWTADNDVAAKAMKSAIEVMESQQGTTDSKLKAAKVILEFTQTKPVVKNETTIKSAEDFLSALMEGDVDLETKS